MPTETIAVKTGAQLQKKDKAIDDQRAKRITCSENMQCILF